LAPRPCRPLAIHSLLLEQREPLPGSGGASARAAGPLARLRPRQHLEDPPRAARRRRAPRSLAQPRGLDEGNPLMIEVDRLMRLRRTQQIRDLCDEVQFTTSQLIQPLFVVDGIRGETPVSGLPDNPRMDVDTAVRRVEADLEAGVRHFLLFPVPATKAARDLDPSFAAHAISTLRAAYGDACTLWVDTCLCSSTDHGHCCVFGEHGQIDHEATLELLSRSAVMYAQAGADGVSPSDMMDGRVAHIRRALDEAGFAATPIMSYSTKFASSFYGPFREAA